MTIEEQIFQNAVNQPDRIALITPAEQVTYVQLWERCLLAATNVKRKFGLKQGDRITVMIPALDGRETEAVVNYIAVRESYATWKATKSTAMYDAKTFEVRAVPVSKVEGLLPGMSALVKQ